MSFRTHAAAAALVLAAGCAAPAPMLMARPLGVGNDELSLNAELQRTNALLRTPLTPVEPLWFYAAEAVYRHGFSESGDVLVTVGAGGMGLGFKDGWANETLSVSGFGLVRARVVFLESQQWGALRAGQFDGTAGILGQWSPHPRVHLVLQPRVALFFIPGFLAGSDLQGTEKGPDDLDRARFSPAVGLSAAFDVTQRVRVLLHGDWALTPFHQGPEVDASAPQWSVGASLQVLSSNLFKRSAPQE